MKSNGPRGTPETTGLNWLKFPSTKTLNMLTFEKLCEIRFVCHIYKYLNNVFPHWYFQLPLIIETRNRNTRQKKDLFTPDL